MVGVPGRSGGRNRKTTAEHKLNGSYRADRHDGRIDGVDAAGDQRKPDDLSPLQVALWGAIVDRAERGQAMFRLKFNASISSHFACPQCPT